MATSIVRRLAAPRLRLRLDGSSREIEVELPAATADLKRRKRRHGERAPLVRLDEAERALELSFAPCALRDRFAGSDQGRRVDALSGAELAAAIERFDRGGYPELAVG